MQILILIPIGLLALLIWAVISLGLLRNRVHRLELEFQQLRRRVEDSNRERPVSPVEDWSSAASPEPAPAEAAEVSRDPGVEIVGSRPIREPQEAIVPPFLPAAVAGASFHHEGSPPVEGPAPLRSTAPERAGSGSVNWEQFMGVKLFAWVGGLVLFLAVAFFVKYSFDKGWISPAMRVAAGFVTGLGLVAGGATMSRRSRYQAAGQSLCGSGIVILYSASFAACVYYRLISEATAFTLMVLVTVTAFFLADRLPAMVVAILGLLGGFLTPPLLSTGVDRPLGLFSYIAILDAGLIAVALRRRWYFLVALAGGGTVLMQLSWMARFFEVGKVGIALAIFTTFNVLFLLAFVAAERFRLRNVWNAGTAIALPFATLAFVFWFLSYQELGARPGMIFSFLATADAVVLILVLFRGDLFRAHLAAGAVVFMALSAWTSRYLDAGLLNWAFVGYLAFAGLHALFPVILQRVRPDAGKTWLGHFFPPLALVLVMLPLFRLPEVTWVIWPVILLIDGVAIVLALYTGAVLGVLSVVALTVVVTALWLFQVPAETGALPELLVVAGGFALFFFVVGLFLGERFFARMEASQRGDPGGAAGALPRWLLPAHGEAELRAQIPALASIMPFLLLILAVARLPLVNPSPVFGLALLLLFLLLAVARLTRVDLLVPVGLGCVLALEYAWHNLRFDPSLSAGTTLAWTLGFTLLFLVYPFAFRDAFLERTWPWASAALAGPLHFFIVHRIVRLAWPNEFMGMVPALFAVPMIGALVLVHRALPVSVEARTRLLAWFGGSALFFITLIFPVQFQKEWITVGWALEGAALLWLFRRVPHPGLRGLGLVLLAIAFTRLALNPAVFDYHPRSGTRILNWYLYAYGIAIACLLAGARLLAPPRHRVFGRNAPPVLLTLASVLAFLLLNIEIADFFSQGNALTFEFNESFGQDMTYSIAWALFALVILALGFRNQSRAARISGMGLLVVTLLKLFLHDLWRLGGLYRVGSLIGLAVVLIVVSLIYQRFLSGSQTKETAGPADGSRPS